MKKIFFAMPLLALALASCDPSDIEGGSEWRNVAADQLKVSATPVQVDGKNSNQIHVVCNSPTNVAWQADQLIENTTNTVSADATIYFTKLGQNTVKCLTTNVGGTPEEKDLTVQVDTITYLTDDLKNRLCVGQTGGADHFGVGFNKALIKVEQDKNAQGRLGNKLNIVSNVNPVLCTFKWGTTTLDKNIGSLTVYDIDKPLKLSVDIMDAAGNTKTIDLGEYTAQTYTEAPAEIKLITGCDPKDPTTANATKTWVLSAGNNWGNGASTDAAGSWWTTDVTGQGGSYGEMTFSWKDGTLTTTIYDESNQRGDKSGTGTFKLDFSARNTSTNVICNLITSGSGNIVFPYIINENYKESHNFEITKVTDEDLYIRAQHTTPGGEGTFWHFVVKK